MRALVKLRNKIYRTSAIMFQLDLESIVKTRYLRAGIDTKRGEQADIRPIGGDLRTHFACCEYAIIYSWLHVRRMLKDGQHFWIGEIEDMHCRRWRKVENVYVH